MKHIFPIIAALLLSTLASAQLKQVEYELVGDDKTAVSANQCGDHGFFMYVQSREENTYEAKILFHNTEMEQIWEQTITSSEGLVNMLDYQVDADGTFHLLLGELGAKNYAVYTLTPSTQSHVLVTFPAEENVADFIVGKQETVFISIPKTTNSREYKIQFSSITKPKDYSPTNAAGAQAFLPAESFHTHEGQIVEHQTYTDPANGIMGYILRKKNEGLPGLHVAMYDVNQHKLFKQKVELNEGEYRPYSGDYRFLDGKHYIVGVAVHAYSKKGSGIFVREVFCTDEGLKSFVPFYQFKHLFDYTLDEGKTKNGYTSQLQKAHEKKKNIEVFGELKLQGFYKEDNQFVMLFEDALRLNDGGHDGDLFSMLINPKYSYQTKFFLGVAITENSELIGDMTSAESMTRETFDHFGHLTHSGLTPTFSYIQNKRVKQIQYNFAAETQRELKETEPFALTRKADYLYWTSNYFISYAYFFRGTAAERKLMFKVVRVEMPK